MGAGRACRPYRIICAAVRTANQKQAGLEFAVENTGEGVVPEPLKPIVTTTLDEVAHGTTYSGKARTPLASS